MDILYEVIQTEINQSSSDITTKLDRFRNILEPYIYNYLLTATHTKLSDSWKSYLPPTQSEYAAVIVERRHHPNFEFILKNLAWAAPYMSVYIFCSDQNRNFISSILKDKEQHYNIIQIFKGNPSREEGKYEYNRLLVSPTFYKQINAKYMLTVQMDCIFRRHIPKEIFKGDYWGNPWSWKQEYPGGGGATVRRIDKMVEICSKSSPDLSKPESFNEDSWISDQIFNEGNFPPITVRRQYIMESLAVMNPYILHQFWTFIEQYQSLPRDHFIAYLEHLLTLEP
jgi:hypothetical protein